MQIPEVGFWKALCLPCRDDQVILGQSEARGYDVKITYHGGGGRG